MYLAYERTMSFDYLHVIVRLLMVKFVQETREWSSGDVKQGIRHQSWKEGMGGTKVPWAVLNTHYCSAYLIHEL